MITFLLFRGLLFVRIVVLWVESMIHDGVNSQVLVENTVGQHKLFLVLFRHWCTFRSLRLGNASQLRKGSSLRKGLVKSLICNISWLLGACLDVLGFFFPSWRVCFLNGYFLQTWLSLILKLPRRLRIKLLQSSIISIVVTVHRWLATVVDLPELELILILFISFRVLLRLLSLEILTMIVFLGSGGFSTLLTATVLQMALMILMWIFYDWIFWLLLLLNCAVNHIDHQWFCVIEFKIILLDGFPEEIGFLIADYGSCGIFFYRWWDYILLLVCWRWHYFFLLPKWLNNLLALRRKSAQNLRHSPIVLILRNLNILKHGVFIRIPLRWICCQSARILISLNTDVIVSSRFPPFVG